MLTTIYALPSKAVFGKGHSSFLFSLLHSPVLKVSARGAQGWATGLALDSITLSSLHEVISPKRRSRTEHGPRGWLLQFTLKQLIAVN